MGTLRYRIADYVCGLRFDQIPEAVVAKTVAVLTHDLAVAVAGSRAPESRRALAFARGGAGGPGRARIIGTGEQRAPIDAAFVNSVMMRALRHEDSILPSFIHPGPMVIPAAFAIGEEVGASGAEVITAIVAGYDVCAKLAGADWTWRTSDRTPSHVFGGFGAAVAAAKLLGCDRHQTATAIAYAGNLAAMITYGFDNHQYGLLTRNGMAAAYLGLAGAPAPDDALEGPHGFYRSQLGSVPSDLVSRFDGCGTDFEIMTAVLKPHPCTSINLVPTGLLQRILADHAISTDQVRAVTVGRSRECADIPGIHDHGPWPDSRRTISSLPFALAAVLADGSVTAQRLHDPGNAEIVELAKRIHIDLLPTTDLLHHTIELTTTDGRIRTARGAGEILPTPDPRVILADHGSAIIGADNTEALLRAIANLASPREITRYLS